MLSYSNTKIKNKNKSSNGRLIFRKYFGLFAFREEEKGSGMRGEGVLGGQSPCAPSWPLGSCHIWDKSYGEDTFGLQQGKTVGFSVPSFVGKYTPHKHVYVCVCTHPLTHVCMDAQKQSQAHFCTPALFAKLKDNW